MSVELTDTPQVRPPSRYRRATRFSRKWLTIIVLGYLCLAYLLIPLIWFAIEPRHPAIDGLPRHSMTSIDIPGDPLNIALIGDETSLKKAILAAGWYPADALTFDSSVSIVADTVLRRKYDDAPVSSLYVWGRKQDLAFEQPVGPDPRKRHHVRFWRAEEVDSQNRLLWIGGATSDISVEFSRRTGQITHHIDANIDAERDKLIADLSAVHALDNVSWIDGFQEKLTGHNGGGDAYHTDGRLVVGTLTQQD
jgi:hypothetical protein